VWREEEAGRTAEVVVGKSACESTREKKRDEE